MQRLPQTVVRMVAIILLAWTAVDLCAPSLCASEAVAIANPSRTNGSARLTAHPANAGDCGDQQDDCFCCSHAVDLRTVTFRVSAAVPLQLIGPSTPLVTPAVTSPPYHPPQG